VLGGRRQTAAAHPLVAGGEGPADAVGQDDDRDARRPPEAEERQSGHDGAVPVPDGAVQRAQHQAQGGAGPAQRAV